MHAISRSFSMLWDALFLQTDAYERMRDDDNPFVEGLFLLVLLGLLLAVVGIVGTTLEWASSPPLAAIQQAVLGGLQKMQWYQDMEGSPEFVTQFRAIWDQVWRIVGLTAPSPITSLTGIITKPLSLIVGWLVFGVIAYILARLFGGKGNLNQTLGATALGAAPQLLLIVTVLPFTAVAGLAAWTLLCNYMALRTVHGLSWPRAVFAALLPPLIITLIIGFVLALLTVLFGGAIAAMMAGGLQ